MAFIQYRRQPVLRSPVVVAAFAGWNDAADSATTAIKFLIDRWKPAKLAEIDSEEFLSLQRPALPPVSSMESVSLSGRRTSSSITRCLIEIVTLSYTWVLNRSSNGRS